jgi:hypothetical protein
MMERQILQAFCSSIGSAVGIREKLLRFWPELVDAEKQQLTDYVSTLASTISDVRIPACLR